MTTASKINPELTLEYMVSSAENQYFDRKSAKIKPSDLAEHICGLANAHGGTLAIGISDKKPIEVQGINSIGDDKINDLMSAAAQHCSPYPECETEFLDVENAKGEADRILLIHVTAFKDRVVRMAVNGATFLRIADKTLEVRGDNLRTLEYRKNLRHFENEICPRATFDDVDPELLALYQNKIGAIDLDIRQVLRARHFIEVVEGQEQITNGAMLLFAKNTLGWYPQCRVRFLRYEGVRAHVGTQYNVVKDVSFDLPILRIIPKAKEFIRTQLRDFTKLDSVTGRFISAPEYPEFAWEEGLVNAVIHRDYSTGEHIRVSMYDDRIEILSPGALPGSVTLQNILTTRAPRNHNIARVMTDLEWARELNEGVPRIYREMENMRLPVPEFSEPNHVYVKLVLKNNILNRRAETPSQGSIQNTWKNLDDIDKVILDFLAVQKEVSRSAIDVEVGKTPRTVGNHLKKLQELKLIKRNKAVHSPLQTYSLFD